MVSSRRRLALMGACIASLLLAAAFFGSTGSAAAGKNRAQSSNNKRSDAAVPARPTLLSPRAGAQRGASGHARAVRTAPLSAHFEGAIDGSDPTQAGRLFRDGIPDTCARTRHEWAIRLGTASLRRLRGREQHRVAVLRRSDRRHGFVHGHQLHLLGRLYPDVQSRRTSWRTGRRTWDRARTSVSRALLVQPGRRRARVHRRERGHPGCRLPALHGRRQRRRPGRRDHRLLHHHRRHPRRVTTRSRPRPASRSCRA